MTRVAIAGAASLPCGHTWEATSGDLAIEVAGPLLGAAPIDALFVAAPAALPIRGQACEGAVLADRLSLRGVASYQVESGDASGAAALHLAYAHVAAGLSRAALVLGVSKVSDHSERERAALMDSLIDQEVEAPLGLTYAALAGLLADLYLQEHGQKRGVFSQVVAKNAANAVLGGETFLPYAPTAQELRRDIPVAEPLLRSDFAPIFDGATALLITDLEVARELCTAPVEIEAIGSSTDTTILSERPSPLSLAAVGDAARACLARSDMASVVDAAFLEIHNACSILEVLGVEALGVCEPGTIGALLKDGFGRVDAAYPINPSGGQHGRGLAFGASGLEQAREVFVQLSGQAGARQVAGAIGPGVRAMSVAMAGLGIQAFATIYRGTA